MKRLKDISLVLLAVLLAIALPFGTALASGTEITPDIQNAFDLTAATADTATRTRLKIQFSEFSALAAQYDSREAQIRTLHDNNAQALIALRERIKEIDTASVAALTTQVNHTKQGYQPLFDQYSALNSRISLLRGLKDKNLNAVLRAQADAMKILVQVARQEIRDKEALLKAAKDTRSKKIAAARKTLAGIESPQTSIKSQKSVVSALNKRLSADWGDFKSAIRKQNTVLAAQSLSSMVSGYRQIAACKLSIIELEQKVSSVIASTSKQIGV